MSWEFLHLSRRTWRSGDNWGTLYMNDGSGKWERLSYTFERPWFTDEQGRSKETVVTKGGHHIPGSRIVEGLYELEERSHGPKGWRLQLLGTGHRTEIQIHRAHKSLYIEGCILPVSFMDFREDLADGKLRHVVKKGDLAITQESLKIMSQIHDRYSLLSKRHSQEGRATILISACLPAYHRAGAIQVATV